MDTPADIFNGYRPRLFGIAYRMLGSRAAGRFLRSGPWSLRLLSYTFHMLISEQHRGERPSRVTFELQPMGSVVKLTLTHDDFESEKATLETTRHGWPAIMSSLKSLLETGSPLPFKGLGFESSTKEPGRL